MKMYAQAFDDGVVFHRQFEQHGDIIAVSKRLSAAGLKRRSLRRRSFVKLSDLHLAPQTFPRARSVFMLDLRIGDELSFGTHAALLLQIDILDTILQHEGPVGLLILVLLLVLSIYSWTVIFSKLAALRRARKTNARFLRAFRKAGNLEAVVVATEQF